MTKYLEYFKDGFNLLKKNPDIYLIRIIWSLFIQLIPNSLGLLRSILTLLSLGFFLSIPKILDSRKNNKEFSPQQILKLSLKSTKRILLPFILLIPIFIIVTLIFGVIIIILLHISSDNFPQIFRGIIIITAAFVIPFLMFTSSFFSIEEINIVKSTVNSIQFSIKNLKFFLIIFVYLISTSILGQVLKDNLKNINIISIVYYLTISSLSLFMTSGSYLFYKKNRI